MIAYLKATARLAPEAARGTALDVGYDTESARPRQMLAERAPAYGRRLAELRRRGLAPTLAVLIVDGWAPVTIEGDHTPWILVIPDNEPPESFHFRVVAGLFVYVIGDEAARINAIVTQVGRYAPKGVFSWSVDADAFTFHARATP